MTADRVIAFCSARHPDSVLACAELARDLGDVVVVVDVASDVERWATSGLRTVPAVLVERAGHTVAQFDGVVDPDRVTAALENGSDDVPLPRRIEPLEVVGSSGSYRYGQWSEPFVVDYASIDRGWSSASRESPHAPWIVFDMLREHDLAAISLWPRPWEGDDTLRRCFPREFEVSLSSDGIEWEPALHVEDAQCRDPLPQRWPFSGRGRLLRFCATKLDQRSNGRFVCQLLGIELWGTVVDRSRPLGPALGTWLRGDHDETLQSSGVYWEQTDGTSITTWRLPPGEGLPPLAILEGRTRFLAVHGTLEVTVQGEHERTLTVAEGQFIALWPGTSFVLRNPGLVHASALEVRTGWRTAEVWAPR